ncbi:hypothetical protein M5D96_003405, partial [Drosophila gunungcola]
RNRTNAFCHQNIITPRKCLTRADIFYLWSAQQEREKKPKRKAGKKSCCQSRIAKQRKKQVRVFLNRNRKSSQKPRPRKCRDLNFATSKTPLLQFLGVPPSLRRRCHHVGVRSSAHWANSF